MAVGNATENKNFGVLAAAAAIIHSSDPDIAMVHVGDDPGEILAQTLKQFNSAVRLLRFSGIEDAQLANLYRHASCLCVPSLSEGFCLPILEAQICGCPVVCSDRSAMPEIAGKGAVLTDPTDPTALATALKSVLDSPEKAASLTQLGLENAKQFSWERTASQYLDQDDGVARNHADQRQHAQHGDEPERGLRHQQGRDHSDHSKRRHAQHQRHALEVLQLEHQNGQD